MEVTVSLCCTVKNSNFKVKFVEQVHNKCEDFWSSEVEFWSKFVYTWLKRQRSSWKRKKERGAGFERCVDCSLREHSQKTEDDGGWAAAASLSPSFSVFAALLAVVTFFIMWSSCCCVEHKKPSVTFFLRWLVSLFPETFLGRPKYSAFLFQSGFVGLTHRG